jgi:hypothetical protein
MAAPGHVPLLMPTWTPEQYKQIVQDGVNSAEAGMSDLLSMLSSVEDKPTRVSYIRRTGGFTADRHDVETTSDLLDLLSYTNQPAIVIIENISPSFVLETGAKLHIDPQFFASHVKSRKSQGSWDYMDNPEDGPLDESRDIHSHLHGIYECQDTTVTIESLQAAMTTYCSRRVWKEPKWSPNASTIISSLARMESKLRQCLKRLIPFEKLTSAPQIFS